MPDFKANLRNRIVGNEVFTGAGLDDLTSGGTHTLDTNTIFTIVIDTVGAVPTDTFKWKKGTEAYTTGVAITGAIQNLSDGVTIIFLATTGHTLLDQWEIQATNLGIDAILSDDGETLAITDRSNYLQSTEVGHLEVNFKDYRALYLVDPSGSLISMSDLQTVNPHWDIANTIAFSDTISYAPGGKITDGVYRIMLLTVPTWDVAVTYTTDMNIYYSGVIYSAKINVPVGTAPTGNALDPNWASISPIIELVTFNPQIGADYFDEGQITLRWNMLKCYDEKVYDSNCDISKNCFEEFATDPKQVILFKLDQTIRSIEIATKLKAFNKAQQLVEKATDLCKQCTC